MADVNDLLLFFLRAVELVSYSVFFRNLERRRHGLAADAAEILGFAALQVICRYILGQFVDSFLEFYYITFFYYPILLAFLLCRFRLTVKEGVYYMLIVFLGVHALRFLITVLSRRWLGGNYLTRLGEDGLLPNVLMFSLYAAALNFNMWILEKLALRYPPQKLTWRKLWFMIFVLIPVIYLGNLGIFTPLPQAELPLSVAVMGQISSYCGLAAVIGYNEVQALAEKQRELSQMEVILASQKQQYQIQKETVETLNRKYHDFKNHILLLSQGKQSEEKGEYLGELLEEIQEYEAFQHTGNEALDVVLTNKRLECLRKKIQLLLFLDGKPLSFMKPLDIVGIFGNALDNAIAAVESLAPEKREIKVRMTENEDWLSLRFENPVEVAPVFDSQGLPVVTGEDEELHGIGLKSIRSAVEKYGGNMQVSVENGVFILGILFPKNR